MVAVLAPEEISGQYPGVDLEELWDVYYRRIHAEVERLREEHGTMYLKENARTYPLRMDDELAARRLERRTSGGAICNVTLSDQDTGRPYGGCSLRSGHLGRCRKWLTPTAETAAFSGFVATGR